MTQLISRIFANFVYYSGKKQNYYDSAEKKLFFAFFALLFYPPRN